MRFATTPRLLLLALASTVSCSPILERAIFVDDASSLAAEYDYIVIGGGTSGLTVANRLTENPATTVLVIEYGQVDDMDPGVLVPGVAPPMKYMRNYISPPLPGLNGRTGELYTAQVVGGGTVINGMYWNRGAIPDYTSWVQLGNPGWSWDDLLPYFKKSENFTRAPKDLENQYPISPDLAPHGTTGPVQVSFPVYQYPVVRHFYAAWKSLGVTLNPQPNAGDATGACYAPNALTFWNQSRCSASTAYYRPIAGKRPNFHLITGQSVSKISIDKSMRATGVTFIQRHDQTTTHSVCASKEVILAAGAARSPGVLQLSGIGPKKLLKSLGIDVVLDLPGVGYNFGDQPSVLVQANYTTFTGPTPDDLFNPAFAVPALAEYYANRTGPYTIVYNSGTTTCYLPLPNITSKYQQIIDSARTVNLASVLPPGTDDTILAGYKAQVKIILDLYGRTDNTVQETAYSGSSYVPYAILRPLSRGSILINSTDPFADPVYYPNTFQHPTDVDIAVASLRKNREFFATPAMQQLGTVETVPGVQYQTDSEIAEALRNIFLTSWQHPSGTLSMMPLNLGGVVDPELKVYGIKALRVVDASIFPIIPATHTTPIVYAVAEKAADMIKASQ